MRAFSAIPTSILILASMKAWCRHRARCLGRPAALLPSLGWLLVPLATLAQTLPEVLPIGVPSEVPGSVSLTCPRNISVGCTSDLGALVEYAPPTATSPGCPGSVAVHCTPASPYQFPIGVTTVTCTATNLCGRSDACSFTVTVVGHGNGAPRGRWARADGGESFQSGNALAVGRDGSSFVGGNFRSRAHFNGAQTNLSSAGIGDTDGFLARYDTAGSFLWAVRFGGTGDDEARGVAMDAQGNCFVTGVFQGLTATFSSTSSSAVGTVAGSSVGQSRNAFLAKYGPLGELVWVVAFVGKGEVTGEGVAVDPTTGDPYITGTVGPSGASFDSTGSSIPYPLGGSGDTDCYLARYGNSGVLSWVDRSSGFAGTHRAGGRGVAVSPAGEAWIVGEFNGAPRFVGQSLATTTTLSSPPGNDQVFVARHGSAPGSGWTWVKQTSCGRVCGNHHGRAIAVDAAGNCYFTANHSGDAKLGGLPPVSGVNGLNLQDYLVGSLRSDGVERWLIQGPQATGFGQESHGLATDGAGDVHVTGSLKGTGLPATAGHDVWLNRFRGSDGVLLWAGAALASAPESQLNAGRGVALDAAGCVYVTGSFGDTSLTFSDFPQPTMLAAPTSPLGQTKMFLAKYCPACVPVSSRVVVTGQPRSQTMTADNSVTFSVAATGALPMTYLWRKNGLGIPGANAATYTITQAAASDAGVYDVVVSNPSDSLASAPATLNLIGPGNAYTLTMLPGDNLIANQLDRGNNRLNSVLPSVPVGTVLHTYTMGSFTKSSHGPQPGAWDPDLSFAPGEGAILRNTGDVPFTITFNGEQVTPSLPLPLRAGFNLVSRQSLGAATFEDIVGRPPKEGTVVYRFTSKGETKALDFTGSSYTSHSFSGGAWDAAPAARPGEALLVRLPQPPPPPDLAIGKVVFTSDRVTPPQVFVKHVGTPDPPVQVTQGVFPAKHPSWSPDGRFIAYVVKKVLVAISENPARDELVIIEENGTPRLILPQQSLGAMVHLTYPEWSPDGKKIALTMDYGGLKVIEFATPYGFTGPYTVTSIVPDGSGAGEPQFSPDGKTIYYDANKTFAGLVWSVPASGGTPTPVSVNGAQIRLAFAPSVSPDGRRLIYNSEAWRDGVATAIDEELLEVDLLTGVGRALTHEPGHQYASFAKGGTGQYVMQSSLTANGKHDLFLATPECRIKLDIGDPDNAYNDGFARWWRGPVPPTAK